MKMFNKFVLVLFVSASISMGQNVTRFRGPNGQGIYPDQNLPVKWNDNNIKWKTKLPGKGHSSPVKWHKNIYVTAADEETNVGFLLAVNAENGKIIWKKEFKIKPYEINTKNTYASPTCTVDSDGVYSLWFSKEKTTLAAFSHSGEPIWLRETEGVLTRHGAGSSPIIVDGKIIFTREQEAAVKSKLPNSWLALDRKTGKTVWELNREMAKSNSQSTPCLYEQNGKKLLIFTSEAHGFTAVNPGDGKIVWEFNPFDARAIASPIIAGDLIIGTVKSGLTAIHPGGNSQASVAYKLKTRESPYVPTPVYVNGLLFNFTDNGSISCHNAINGELIWRENPAGDFYCSPILTNGNLYCQDRDGAVVVIKADKNYQLLAVNQLGEGTHATPIAVNNKLYLRSFSQLFCIGN